ncbi:hypothetical protein S40285_08754 [Stachybotrys chlorohalonatus IBT 40285]|uniref:L-ornithine N(5)-oxygenase n=1 Tax=Stachybotrys chlorohalonatus (strain IBT 40285) TaxID=1283841 RepID=A0A084QZH6_STAC4|nr:hypothetical protein S40285_08754 [Stachybotrys chlorohalonata IBT 40285]
MSRSSSDARPSDKIAIIGGGMAGITMGVQLKRLLNHENFHIYEKSDSVGGTWAQNRYPNLTCDVASEFYSFSFFQNPNWSEKYASQPEILDYIQDCARHFQLGSHIHLQQECLSMTWSEAEQLWTLCFRDLAGGKLYAVQARYVITATGVLGVPNGLDGLSPLARFGGHFFHTSQWRNVDFENMRIMVIGNGCSANQVIPWILNQHPRSLVQLLRSAQWVAPKDNHPVSAFTRWCLRYIPFVMNIRRLWCAFQLDRGFVAFRNTAAGAKVRKSAAESITSYMSSVTKPAYHDIMLPHYELGAKRPVMDHGYLEATNHPHFTAVRCDGIASVEGDDLKTIIDEAGNRHEIDFVIVANGFKTQDLLAPMEIRGLKGRDLHESWQQRGGPEAYLGVSVHGFPNLFMLAGPNTLPSGNSTLHGIECSAVYITRLLGGLWGAKCTMRSDGVSLMPTQEAEARYNATVQKDIGKLIYTSQVSTWYINKETGKNTLIWPGTQFSFWWNRCVSPIKWSDWSVEKHD